MAHDDALQLKPAPTGPGDGITTSRLPVEIQLDILDLVVGDLDALSLLWEVSSPTESALAVRPLCVGNEEDHYAKTRARRLRNISVLLPQTAPCIDQCFARVPVLGGPGSHGPSSYWVDFQRDVFAPLARTKQNGVEIGRAPARSTWVHAPGEAESFLAHGRRCRGREMIQNILVPEDSYPGDGPKGLETAKSLPGLRRIYVLQAFVARYPQGFAAGSLAQHIEAWARDARASAGADGTAVAWPFSVVLEALAEIDPGAGQARTLWTTERPDAFWPYAPDWYHKRHGVAGRMKSIGEGWMRTQAPRVEMVLISPRRGGGLEPTFLDGRILAPPRPCHGLK